MKAFILSAVIVLLLGSARAADAPPIEKTSSIEEWWRTGEFRYAEDDLSEAMRCFSQVYSLLKSQSQINRSNIWAAVGWMLQCSLHERADLDTLALARKYVSITTNQHGLRPELVAGALAKAALAAADNQLFEESFTFLDEAIQRSEAARSTADPVRRQLLAAAGKLLVSIPPETAERIAITAKDRRWRIMMSALKSLPLSYSERLKHKAILTTWVASNCGNVDDLGGLVEALDDSEDLQLKREDFPAFTLAPTAHKDIAIAFANTAILAFKGGNVEKADQAAASAYRASVSALGRTNMTTLECLRLWAKVSYARIGFDGVGLGAADPELSGRFTAPMWQQRRAQVALPIQLAWTAACTNRFGTTAHQEHADALNAVAAIYFLTGDKSRAFTYSALAFRHLEGLNPKSEATIMVGKTAQHLLIEQIPGERVSLARQTGDERLIALAKLFDAVPPKMVIGAQASFHRRRDAENNFRERLRAFREENPELNALVDGLPFRRRSGPMNIDPVKWLDREWNRWNSIFEANVPNSAAVGPKLGNGPFEMLPRQVESNALVMALAVLDLKGWLSERESHLYSTRRRSTNAEVVSLSKLAKELRMRAENMPLKQIATAPSNSLAMGEIKAWHETEQALRRRLLQLPELKRPKKPTVQEVRESLPTGTVLVEFLKYGREPADDAEEIEAHYGAVIIDADKQSWKPLGPACEIEEPIAQLQGFMRTEERDSPTNEVVMQILTRLHQLLWAPIASGLPANTRRILISPDSYLWQLPFGVLWATNHFLGEDFPIMSVESGRSLRMNTKKPSRQPSGNIVAFVDPDFDNKPKAARTGIFQLLGLTKAFGEASLKPLPNSRLELVSLQKLALENRMDPPKEFVAKNADESSIRGVNRPWLLHLSTHGFFAPVVTGGTNDLFSYARLASSPAFQTDQELSRCGLALAGANRTLDAWQSGQLVPANDDNLLLGSEIADLELDDTWLVTLSACDTGIGYLAEGEGCLNIQRAFMLAGARNTVTTLWPVFDDHTPVVFDHFYRLALRSSDLPQALHEVQRDGLRQLRSQKDAHAVWRAVKNYGAYVLTVNAGSMSLSE